MSTESTAARAAPRTASPITPLTATLATLCCLLWAGAYVTGKFAIGTDASPGFGPFRAAFFRFAVAGALLGLWGLTRDPASLRVAREDWPAFGRVALLGIGLTYVFNYPGLRLTTGTAAALIMATEPVWIALLAVIFLREKMTRPRLAGIVLGMTGALLVVLSTQKPDMAGTRAAGEAMLGNVLLVLSLLWEAGAVLTAKRLTTRYKGQAIVTYEFLLGALCLAPFAVWETLEATAPLQPGFAAWASFLYLLIPCTLIAYPVWFRLLAIADASDITVFIFLQPVVGTLLGVLWLNDTFTALTFFGAALVLVGVWGITRQPERVNQTSAAQDETA